MYVINFTTAVLMLVSMISALIYGDYHAAIASLVAVVLAVGFGCEQLKNKET